MDGTAKSAHDRVLGRRIFSVDPRWSGFHHRGAFPRNIVRLSPLQIHLLFVSMGFYQPESSSGDGWILHSHRLAGSYVPEAEISEIREKQALVEDIAS